MLILFLSMHARSSPSIIPPLLLATPRASLLQTPTKLTRTNTAHTHKTQNNPPFLNSPPLLFPQTHESMCRKMMCQTRNRAYSSPLFPPLQAARAVKASVRGNRGGGSWLTSVPFSVSSHIYFLKCPRSYSYRKQARPKNLKAILKI